MKNIYSQSSDDWQEYDRQFFLQNPKAQSFERQYFAGEFGGNYIDIKGVLVTQIEVGLRVRSPILETKKKRRSSKGKVKGFRIMR